MNARPLVITGTFADLKSVKTRSVVQLIIEAPIEQAEQIVAILGYPQPGKEVPVAVARLNERAATAKPDAPLLDKPAKPKSYAQRIGILCNEGAFWSFLNDRIGALRKINNPEDAAECVRHYCGVASRRDIVPGTPAGTEWHSLDLQYQNWLSGIDPLAAEAESEIAA